MSTLPLRDTARALVFDPRNRLLLIAYQAVRDVDPARPGFRRFWFTPGGGLEPGETHEQALTRELEEEIGVPGTVPGPCIARREVEVTLFRRQSFTRERYFAVRLPSDVVDTALLASTEDDPVLDVRWWPLEALLATDEIVIPVGLATLARDIAAGRMPETPVRLA